MSQAYGCLPADSRLPGSSWYAGPPPFPEYPPGSWQAAILARMRAERIARRDRDCDPETGLPVDWSGS